MPADTTAVGASDPVDAIDRRRVADAGRVSDPAADRAFPQAFAPASHLAAAVPARPGDGTAQIDVQERERWWQYPSSIASSPASPFMRILGLFLMFLLLVVAGRAAAADDGPAGATVEAPAAATADSPAAATDSPAAATSVWSGADGRPAPDTESRKSLDGFGGWVATTSDADWRAKWETPADGTPTFTVSRTVKRGERLAVLIFLKNPAVDAQNAANVRCDLRVTRPDGSHPVDAADVTCLQGVLVGDAMNVRIAAPVIDFVGEPADLAGTWTVEVSLRDAVRDRTLALKTTFDLTE